MIARSHIHRLAAEHGFAACGVTRVRPVDDAEMQRLDSWIASGRAGGMEYMSRHRELRRDPSLLLDGARTMVCLALPYTPSTDVEGFAHYALGRDYHDIVRQRATALAAALTVGCASDTHNAAPPYRVCVDTAPVMERYWASVSGVGWIGRNHLLIAPNAGSEVFLCEILLTDETDEIDSPMAERCGACRRCIDACPTGALRADGAFDARRCNSYLTIEHRGAWTEHRPSKGCLYGCDACQRSCPWQRFARPTREEGFEPSPALLAMRPTDWQSLTEEQFRTLFGKSAVKRAKYEGLKRNIKYNYEHDTKTD